MYNEYNRNNCSLFSIPECIYNPNYIGKPDYTVWSVHTWVHDDRFRPSYQVWIRYSFYPDERGYMRARAKNIWNRSNRLEIYCQGVKLEGIDLDQAKAEIRSRLLRLLDYKSLKGKPITRYRFNYIASFPEGSLAGLDCHHESGNNINIIKLCEVNGVYIREEWLKATDDRIDNLVREDKFEHKLIHFANGDHSFYPYLDRNSYISLANETSEPCGVEGQIRLVNDKWVNDCKQGAPAFLNYQQMKELWGLYNELRNKGFYPMQTSNVLMQT